MGKGVTGTFRMLPGRTPHGIGFPFGVAVLPATTSHEDLRATESRIKHHTPPPRVVGEPGFSPEKPGFLFPALTRILRHDLLCDSPNVFSQATIDQAFLAKTERKREG